MERKTKREEKIEFLMARMLIDEKVIRWFADVDGERCGRKIDSDPPVLDVDPLVT